MNKIALTYTIDDSGNRQRTIEPHILVDGLPFHADYTVDIFEATASGCKEGECFIFTCGAEFPVAQEFIKVFEFGTAMSLSTGKFRIHLIKTDNQKALKGMSKTNFFFQRSNILKL